MDAALGDGILGEKLQDNECYQELSSQLDLRKAAAQEDDLGGAADDVADAILADHSHELFRKQVTANFFQTPNPFQTSALS